LNCSVTAHHFPIPQDIDGTLRKTSRPLQAEGQHQSFIHRTAIVQRQEAMIEIEFTGQFADLA
jgi:hypothetical protein